MASSTDTKIRFTVDGVTQLHQEFQKILTDSQSLTKEWEAQGSSIVKSLREQLELLRKRNEMAVPPSTASQFRGATGASQGSNLGDIEKALEDMVTDGIRFSKASLAELAELLKGTSVAGGPSNGGGGSNGSNGGKGSDKNDDNSKEGVFSSAVGRFALNNMLNPLQSNDPAKSMMNIGSNAGSALMQTGNPYAMAAGAAISMIMGVLKMKYDAVADIAPVGAEAARMFGGNWAEYSIRNSEFEQNFGLSAKEALQRRIALGQAMGRQTLGSNVYDATLWEQTTTLGQQDILNLARSARGDSAFSVDRNLSMLMNNLNRSGVNNEKIQTQMSEYLREIVNLNQTQVQQLGRADTGFNTGLYSMVASVLPKTAESSPEFIGKIAGSIYQGLANPKTPQTQALRWDAIRRANPNASWFDVKMMTEDPNGNFEGLSENEIAMRRQATQNYLTALWGAGGDWNGRAALLQSEFGLSANVAGTLAKGDKIDFKKFFEEIDKAKKDDGSRKDDLQGSLKNTVDAFSKVVAEWQGTKLGENVDAIRGFVEDIANFLAKDDNPNAGAKSMLGANYEVANSLREKGGFWNNFIAGMISNPNMI